MIDLHAGHVRAVSLDEAALRALSIEDKSCLCESSFLWSNNDCCSSSQQLMIIIVSVNVAHYQDVIAFIMSHFPSLRSFPAI